jgi:hypothetical protein
MGVNYNPKIVTDGLLLYLDAANPTLPRIGNTLLSLNGGMSSPSNGYYIFDGTDDSVGINSSVYNQNYTGKTVIVAARMNLSFGNDVFRALVGTSSGTNSRNFNFYIYKDNTGYRFHFSTGNGSATSGTFSDYLNINLNEWFIGAVSLNSSNSVTYYFNGNTAGTSTQTFSQFNSGTSEFIGRADNFWYGDIAYVSVYSKALATTEIQQNFNATRGRYGI